MFVLTPWSYIIRESNIIPNRGSPLNPKPYTTTLHRLSARQAQDHSQQMPEHGRPPELKEFPGT